LMDELTGNEFDIQGLNEFQALVKYNRLIIKPC
jgi:hypothetical protein